jgi:hypothetical protein
MMNEHFANLQSLSDPVSPLPGERAPEAAGDRLEVALTLEIASSAALLTILTTVSRLGCQTTYVHACEQWAALEVRAPRRVAHRLVPCLEQLIDVLSVVQGLDEPPIPARSLAPPCRATGM